MTMPSAFIGPPLPPETIENKWAPLFSQIQSVPAGNRLAEIKEMYKRGEITETEAVSLIRAMGLSISTQAPSSRYVGKRPQELPALKPAGGMFTQAVEALPTERMRDYYSRMYPNIMSLFEVEQPDARSLYQQRLADAARAVRGKKDKRNVAQRQLSQLQGQQAQAMTGRGKSTFAIGINEAQKTLDKARASVRLAVRHREALKGQDPLKLYLERYPWEQRFRGLSPRARGEYTRRFRAPTRTLNY